MLQCKRNKKVGDKMYYFYKEKKDEFLKGRTIKYLSYLMGITWPLITEEYIYNFIKFHKELEFF